MERNASLELQKAVYALEDDIGDLAAKLSFLIHTHQRLGDMIQSLRAALDEAANKPAPEPKVQSHPRATHRSAWSP